MISQYEITLPHFKRGFHLITDLVVNEIEIWPETGILHLFIKHTSAALALNENADPSVRHDFEKIINKLIPENQPEYDHRDEGSDDMPAHAKSSIIGQSLSIPITDGRLNLGIWQGVYLCEFRNHGHARELVATVYS